MTTATAAAGLIAGMIQATRELGTQWEKLSENERPQLVSLWEQVIQERPVDAPSEIVASIANHPLTANVWKRLEHEVYNSRIGIIQTVVKNTIHS